MERRIFGRLVGAGRRLAVLAAGAIVLTVLAESRAGAQTVVIGPIAVSTTETGGEVVIDGAVYVEVSGETSSSTTSSSSEGEVLVEGSGGEVMASGESSAGPGSSVVGGTVAVATVGGPEVSESFFQECGPVAGPETCPPAPAPPPPDAPPPPPAGDGVPPEPVPAPDAPPVDPGPESPPPVPADAPSPPTADAVPPTPDASPPAPDPAPPGAAAAPPPPAPSAAAPAPAAAPATAVALAVGPAVAIDPPAPAGDPPPLAAPPPPAPGAAPPPVPGTAPAPAGRITLTVLNEDGLASGPPGVGVTVAGTGFPVTSRELAAAGSIAQGAAGCRTVYFRIDGVRFGSAQPDAAGNVHRDGLSVPGGIGPGTHEVSASCRSAGTPVLVAAPFEVTEVTLHRSGFATALHRPDHVDFAASSLLLSALGALAMMMLIAFPAELFNTTLEANYDEVRGWFGLRPRPPTAGTGVKNVAVFVLFLALSGPLCLAMLRSSALDLTTVLAAAGLSFATAIVVFGSQLPTYLHLHRRYGERANVVALPGTLIVAVACVLLSRAVRFEPGYFYGLVGGLAFTQMLRKETSGRLAAGSVVVMVGLSMAAWLALTPVARMADAPEPGAWPILVEAVLGGIFWVALDSLVIALLPLRLLTGSKIFGWRRLRWAVLYAITLFAFIHILLRPGTGYVSDSSRSPTVVVVVLFVGFAVLSFAFWGYFRFRAPHPEERTTAAVS